MSSEIGQMPKIRIKNGNFELEYEGEQSFIEDKLTDFVQLLIGGLEHQAETERSTANNINYPAMQISTNTIAQKVDAKTGSDLVIAAIAKIQIIDGKNSAQRQEILAEMREATTYFKETFASNLSAYLDNLVRAKRLNLVSRQTFSLPAPERSKLSELLMEV
jgi:hypothetical protein